jgi:release factor glutamine methyltransferase
MFFADISLDALEIAKANAKKILRAEIFSRSVFIQSNLFENFPRSKNGIFDVIISNPPYVPFSVTRELLQDGRSEPAVALCGDVKKDGTISDADDGISVIKNLILESKDFLNPRGKIILETGEYNAEKTESILKNSGFVQTKIFCDLEGQFRNVMGTISRKR